MKLRHLLPAFVLLAAMSAATAQQSLSLIAKPITVVVGFPPGGASDTIARTIAEQLAPRINQTVIVENRPGANGAIANQYVRQRPADGTTLYVVPTSFSTAPVTDPDMHKYDPATDFTPIARLTSNTTVLVASSTFPHATIPDLIAYAAANPEKVSIGTTGNGSNDHLGSLRLQQAAKVTLNIIHYKGSAEAMRDLMAGVLDLKIDSYASARPALDSGRVKLLALTTLARTQEMPNLSTVAETLPGFEVASYFGIVGPAGMPAELTRKLSSEMMAILETSTVRQRFKGLGMDVAPLPAAEFATFMSNHLKTQQSVVKDSGFVKDWQ